MRLTLRALLAYLYNVLDPEDADEFAGKVIGAGIANVITAVTPRRIVIGGGVAAAGELILDPIRRSMRARVFLVDSLKVEVVQAQLGNNAGLIGAALWARETIS